jgi:CheY-like chemotaxis protein
LRVVIAPDQPNPLQATSTATPAASGLDLRGLHVLIVDDEDDARELIRRTLESANCTVTTAASAAEALERQAATRFDLLISDIGMPRQDGYALIAAWRRQEAALRIPKTPAIALTAYAQSDDRRKALLAGFNAHLSKPTNVDELATIAASLTDRIGA